MVHFELECLEKHKSGVSTCCAPARTPPYLLSLSASFLMSISPGGGTLYWPTWRFGRDIAECSCRGAALYGRVVVHGGSGWAVQLVFASVIEN